MYKNVSTLILLFRNFTREINDRHFISVMLTNKLSSSKPYNGPFRTIINSNTFFYFSLPNAASIFRNGLIFFKSLSTVSCYFWWGSWSFSRWLVFGDFLISSKHLTRQTCSTHFSLVLTKKLREIDLLYSCRRFHLFFFGSFSSLIYTGSYTYFPEYFYLETL